MSTRPTDPRPVAGRVDGSGRLVAADAALEALQREAGSSLGSPVAIPQLAAIARMAGQLRIPVARRVLAAGIAQDVDMWVRAVPEGDEVVLTIERWDSRPPAGPRLASAAGTDSNRLSSSGRWSVDERLRILGVTDDAAGLLGVPAAEASGQLLTKFIKLDEDSEGEMQLLQALASRGSFPSQPARRRTDDTALVLSGEPVLGTTGSFAGFEGSVALADHSTAQEELARPDPAFDELLRSPLRNIIETADQMAARSDGPLRDEYAAYAADISGAAQHLLSVVGSMGKEPAAPQATIDLVDLVYEAVGLVETAAIEREIAVAVEPLHTFTAHGDSRGVIQILVNLIANAVQHSSSQATVTVSFERSAGNSIVHVADDGPGIAPADQQRIFERFERGKEGGQGSGLGLAIARRLARAMDGDVQLQSRPGHGSRFSLVLPAA